MSTTKNILSLSSAEAFGYFMKADHYCTLELPEYFNFQPVLDFVKEKVKDLSYDQCLSSDPCGLSAVNQDILLNKDGRYAIRPLSLVNPYLYYFLVRDVCDKSNWAAILECFRKYSVPHITSCAIPVVPEGVESFHSSATVLNWWNSMEQRSIELSLEYRYMFVTDITNCYGSINPMDVGRALSMAGTAHATAGRKDLSDSIVRYLRALQEGQNIGIPQGSEIFNLIAEIILGYADLLLSEEIARDKSITHPYEVLRYRDDYRIFGNDKDELEQISYILQRVLRSLNFQMNSKKTFLSESIITDAIKADKQFYVFNTPINRRRQVSRTVTDKDGKEKIVTSWETESDFNGLQKNLLYILLFGRKFPNSGQIRTLLNDFDTRVEAKIKEKEEKRKVVEMLALEAVDFGGDNEGKDVSGADDAVRPKGNSVFSGLKVYKSGRKVLKEDIRPMVAIAAQIAEENVTAAHYALRTISRLVDTLDKDDKDKNDIIDKVRMKLRNQHNANYLEIWLQNMTYKSDKQRDDSHYEQPLCRLVMGEYVELWDNSWLKPSVVTGLPYRSICSEEKLAGLSPVIEIRSKYNYGD